MIITTCLPPTMATGLVGPIVSTTPLYVECSEQNTTSEWNCRKHYF